MEGGINGGAAGLATKSIGVKWIGDIHQPPPKCFKCRSASKSGEYLVMNNDLRQTTLGNEDNGRPIARIFSIGYEGKQIDVFIGILKQNGVERLIDVRQAPYSRKPGFSKKALERELHNAGIDYVGIPELGTDKLSRDRYKTDGNMAELLAEYRTKFEKNIEHYKLLKKLVCERTSSIMCYEEDFRQCHRQVIENELESDGFRVVRL